MSAAFLSVIVKAEAADNVFYGKESMHKSTTVNSAHTKEKIPAACQEEDAALKTMMQFFAEELLPAPEKSRQLHEF